MTEHSFYCLTLCCIFSTDNVMFVTARRTSPNNATIVVKLVAVRYRTECSEYGYNAINFKDNREYKNYSIFFI